MGFYRSADDRARQQVRTVEFRDAAMFHAAWETDPAAFRRALPPPLEMDGPPVVTVFVASFDKNNFTRPYKEAGLYLRARYGEVRGHYCVSMILDDDIALLIGREMIGMPKKLGSLYLERDGDRVEAWVERHGVRVFDARATLTEQGAASPAKPVEAPRPFCTFSYKAPLSLSGEGFDEAPRLVLSESISHHDAIAPARAEICLRSSDGDPWAELGVERLLGAVYTVGTVCLPRHTARALATVAPEEFAPYAYAGWDRGFHRFG